ncbi:MAG: hypothetical protein NZ528_10580 [Caldilineales bacterium]|nr:hypothetical protein [Caldilineales bacterium]MDW8319100.1 hypothetical protein [Anaerolineae bacterium]
MGEAPGQAASPMASRPPAAAVSSPPAFPGAEGFGASATGGRGGQVIYVTTLDPDPNGELPGSLNWALRQPGPRYILFKVSGVISAAANIVHGDVTIAGQTSPGGIVVRGLICDGHYERNHCDNVIVRHLRSRPARHMDGSEMALDDALRLDGIRNFIIDHSSFAHAVDEVAQVSWASRGTIQNSIFAETVGDHWEYGGMLMNYSTPHHPQDFLSIHHNLWYRLGGRLPEITCEASAYPDEPASATDCAAHPLRLELSNNLLWDPGINIWYGLHVDGNPDLGNYVLHLNWVNNYMAANPATYTYGMILHDVLQAPANQLYFSGNRMNLYPAYADYDLAYCCNDFTAPGANPNTDLGVAVRLTTRHDFPPITYTPTDQLVAYAVGSVGAFPRDPMDRRIIASLLAGQLDFGLPYSQPVASDAFELDFDPNNPPAPPLDTDEDGMPDAWELQHGLNPTVPDHNDTQLSVPLTGVPGYTNLECYLNWLSDRLTAGAVSSIIYLPLISAAGAELRWTTDPANCCYTVHRAATPGLVPSVTTAVSAKLPAAIGAYTDPAAHIGDPAVEDFYLVASCGCDGFTTAESQRVGYMDFALRRGE